jgi:hypothetical protein
MHVVERDYLMVTCAVDAGDATELDRGMQSRFDDPRSGRGSRAVPDIADSDVSGLW